jgi:hypothetical protein
MNLAHQFVISQGKCVAGTREEFDGACIDFAGEFIDSIQRGRLAYFETPDNHNWKYHAAVVIDGIVHDLWEEHPVPLDFFMPKIGASSVDYTSSYE